jgi:hypothetical protein
MRAVFFFFLRIIFFFLGGEWSVKLSSLFGLDGTVVSVGDAVATFCSATLANNDFFNLYEWSKYAPAANLFGCTSLIATDLSSTCEKKLYSHREGEYKRTLCTCDKPLKPFQIDQTLPSNLIA